MKKETGVFKPLSFFVYGMRKNLIFFTKIKKGAFRKENELEISDESSQSEQQQVFK